MLKKYRIFEGEEHQPRQEEGGAKKTAFLSSFAKDLSKMAEDGKLEPVIGRDKEIFQVLWVLSRKLKNNPVIIGEAGTGKTAIVEAIAQKIHSGDCPDSLKDKKIFSIDMGSLAAGASATGDYEKRLKALLKELEENKDIILFIDEIHLMCDSSRSIDAANMFKPALARGDMRLIGATTYNEFRNSIEKDGALDRRFQKVVIQEPSIADTIIILNQIKNRFEDFHKVKYTDSAIEACVKLSGRYITDRFFPDKAIDLLDEVGAKIRLSAGNQKSPEIAGLERQLLAAQAEKKQLLDAQRYEDATIPRQREIAIHNQLKDLLSKFKAPIIEIKDDEVNEIVSIKTGIPIRKLAEDEGEKLIGMENELKMKIIGQDEAVSKISKFMRRSRVGLKDPKRPAGVFLFLGGTGTGKTHTVKQLAKYIFDSEDSLIRVDMSEFREKHTVARLIGSPPGYVGYGEGGQLTEKVRRKPYSIVLLDEVEKAHPDVLNIFLQVFDDGHLTDGQGRKVDFKNCIIIMTSNIGASKVKDIRTPVGFGDKKSVLEESKKSLIMAELHKSFPPEFINRIDDVVIFAALEKDNIYKIIDIEIAKLADKLKDMGYTITITNNVKDLLMDVGYDASMGARPLKRAIQTHLEDSIADEILKKHIKSGDQISIDYDKAQKKLIINGQLITERRRIKGWVGFKLFEELTKK